MPRLTAAKRQALHERRRRQILEAASGVFANRGYAAATIADIARAARVAEGTIYNYFRSKEDLLIHIPRVLAAHVFAGVDRLPDIQTADDAERALITLARGTAERLRANMRFMRVFLSALPYLSRPAREEFMRLLPLAVAGTLEAHLRRGQAQGVYRADLDPAAGARGLLGMLFWFLLVQQVLLARPMSAAAYDAFIRQTIGLFLHGALEQRGPGRRNARGGRARSWSPPIR